MKTYDVVVIGGGPGGYVAAIRCAQLGFETACIDQWLTPAGKPALGGTCLNVGCIPSKALLDSSYQYYSLQHLLPKHGIKVSDTSIDLAAMQARKDKVVNTLTGGIAGLFRKHQVAWLQGHGRLVGDQQVEITEHGTKDKNRVGAKNIIIATGSVPRNLPAAPLDHEAIVDSSGALAFQEIPERLGIIGAGVIGLELGSVWRRLGARVIVLEALEEFLTMVDRQVAKEAFRTLMRQGLDIHLGARVTTARRNGDRVVVEYEDKDGAHTLELNKLIVAVGRSPYTAGLSPEQAGLKVDNQGRIVVDAHCHTGVANIYAIGDVVRGPMLAHKASEEGIAVAELIAGQRAHIDHDIIPWVIYTHPEIAWVGKGEQTLRAEGQEYRSGTFPFRALGRAHAAGETEGLVKIIGDAHSDAILGVHILGAQASELVAEAVSVMAFHGSTEDLARTVHAHPTLAEAMHEAALAVDARPLHI